MRDTRLAGIHHERCARTRLCLRAIRLAVDTEHSAPTALERFPRIAVATRFKARCCLQTVHDTVNYRCVTAFSSQVRRGLGLPVVVLEIGGQFGKCNVIKRQVQRVRHIRIQVIAAAVHREAFEEVVAEGEAVRRARVVGKCSRVVQVREVRRVVHVDGGRRRGRRNRRVRLSTERGAECHRHPRRLSGGARRWHTGGRSRSGGIGGPE
mmetsp:Transcript_62207/g.129032  ORF Transcript_62207/g.129032 Transcript_62207/m.129032 type:complete len:209 (-) Transcript_62207:245-871(-)